MRRTVFSLLLILVTIVALTSTAAGVTPFVRETALTGNYQYASMALDSKGNPHVAMWDVSNQFLVVATRQNNVWSSEVVAANGFVGTTVSLAIDAQDNPHVAFHNFTIGGESVFYVFKSGGVWQAVEQIETPGGLIGTHCSLALDANGIPHVSYNILGQDLRYAVRSAGWVTEYAFQNFADYHTSITIDALGRPHIAHIDDGGTLQYHSVKNAGSWDTNFFDSEVTAIPIFWASIDMGPGDQPAVAYHTQGPKLRFAIRDKDPMWTTEDVHGASGNYCSMKMDVNGIAHISGYDALEGNLKYYKRTAPATWEIEEIDIEGDPGSFTSLALDQYGNPSIAYIDNTSGDLRYADSAIRFHNSPTGTTWPVGAERTVQRYPGTGR